MKKKKISIVFILVTLFSLFWLMPLVLIITNSFKPYNEMMQHFLSLPSSINFDKYIETWTKFDFPRLIGNTLFYTVASVLVVLLIAPMAAYKLARVKSRFSRICFILIIMPMMVPFQSYMISLTKLVSLVHLSSTKTGYLMVNIGLLIPLAVFMIQGFIGTVPMELEESAYIDGAGPYTTYFKIVLPLLTPILTTVIVLDVLATWNDIITNQLIVGGNSSAINIQNALYMRFSAQTSDWEHALPGIVMSMIPSLIFFFIMQKNIIAGATAGAIKG
jgi:raffinose/stachyose/melibiose transport system permease protein